MKREEKVRKIFEQFDKNGDGRLSREEMASLVQAVNPAVRFTEEQISAIMDEVFRTYGEYIDDMGLSMDGLRQTYDDGAGDVNRDFLALGLQQAYTEDSKEESTSGDPDDIGDGYAPAEPPVTPAAKEGTEEEEIGDKKIAKGLESYLFSRQNASFVGKRIKRKDLQLNESFMQAHLVEVRKQADQLPPQEAFAAHIACAEVLYRFKLFNEALKSMRRSAAIDPSNAQLHERIGLLLLRQDKCSESRDAFTKALAVAEEDHLDIQSSINFHMGVAFEREGMLLNAIDFYKDAIALSPTSPEIQKSLGSAYLGLGKTMVQPAITALKKSTELDVHYAEAWTDLGLAYKLNNQPELAARAFENALIKDPNCLEAQFNLAINLQSRGDFVKADEYYRKAIEANPTNWRLSLNRASCLVGIGNVQGAHKALLSAYKQCGRIEVCWCEIIPHKSYLDSTWLPYVELALQYQVYEAMKNLQRVKGKDVPISSPGTSDEASAETKVNEKPHEAFSVKDDNTGTPEDIEIILALHRFHTKTRLFNVDPKVLRQELERQIMTSVTEMFSRSTAEKLMRRVLSACPAQAFQQAMTEFNEKVLDPMASKGTNEISLTIATALIALFGTGDEEERLVLAFDVLRLPHNEENLSLTILENFCRAFGNLIRAGCPETAKVSDVHCNDTCSSSDFKSLFSENQMLRLWSRYLQFEKLVNKRHGRAKCAALGCEIVGPIFYCTNGKFSICKEAYAKRLVPSDSKLKTYIFQQRMEVKRKSILGL